MKPKQTFFKRYLTVGIIFALAFAGLIGRLFYMQHTQYELYAGEADTKKASQQRLVGERGRILDANGMPLAYNTTSYSVEFVRDSTKRSDAETARYTQVLERVIGIIEKNGGSTIVDYNIRKMPDGSFAFWFGSGLDDETYQKRVEAWRKNMMYGSLTSYPDAQAIHENMLSVYQIPEDMPYAMQLKVLSIWQNVRMTSFRSYIPNTIAENVDLNTVAAIEMYGYELDGVQVTPKSTRVYTKKSIAAHVVGYMGKMSDEETIIENEGRGYLRSDLIGVAGVESSLEHELTPNTLERIGVRRVELDSRGNIKNELEYRAPKDGNTVQVTIDTGLQIHLEEALEENIKAINQKQRELFAQNENNDYDGLDVDELRLAQVGASVVMKVHTGEVLSLASYPSFDPNMFTGGLTLAEYEVIRDDARNPLFNKAISSTGTPGSIFKMVTGIAGIAEGVITIDEEIDDEGPYDKHVVSGHAPSCWTRYPANHKDQNIVRALTNSCNYYFYTVADRLGSERLEKWADLLGLTSVTGIELPSERAGQVGSQAALYDPANPPSGTSYLVYQSIKNMVVAACEQRNLTYSSEKYEETAIKIMNLVAVEGNIGPDIRAILMNDLKLTLADIQSFVTKDSEGQDVTTRLDTEISSRISEIRWDVTDTITTGIGQSVTMVSPIAVARYVSAIVNGGDVYEATLVKAILSPDGQIQEKQPQLIRKLDVDPEVLKAILEGMSGVVSPEDGGTAADYFKDFKYLDQLAGKTGTAQVSTIDLENNSWFVAVAPKEQPEIVVVVYIPNGYAGSQGSPTIRAAVEYYMDNRGAREDHETIPLSNTPVP